MRVPDSVWFSDNDYGIPTLRLEQEATDLPDPLKWGSKRRSAQHPGAFHFYTHDYKFTALWSNPHRLVLSGCQVAIEPNFSTGTDMPMAVALWGIYRKRWMARYWQQMGISIWVDVNVEPQFHKLNLLGVPRQWRHYATRYQATLADGRAAGLEMIEQDWAAICQHTGRTDNVLLVYGGRKHVEKYCDRRGWLHQIDDPKTARGEVVYGAR